MQSDEIIQGLLNDRVAFKLYAADQHLAKLKELESAYGDMTNNQARLKVEIEIDCFLSQIKGAADSLLYQINSVFDLGIPEDRLRFPEVQSGLSAKTKKITLLHELDQARQPGNWFAELDKIRNLSMHRTFLKKVVIANDLRPKPDQMKFLKIQNDFEGNPIEHVMQEDVISYLESSLQKTNSMIENIRKGEPALQPR